MEFPEESITEIVRSVWETMLELEAEAEAKSSASASSDDFACCVQITGDWSGAVTLHCTRELATALACKMFGMEPVDLDPSLIRDALGELINMVAGNIKGLAPGEDHHVSMPAVAEGEHSLLSVPGSHQVGEIWFDCQGEPMHLTLLEKSLG